MTDNKTVMQQALQEIESYWRKVDGEWGPSEGGLERAILSGEEPVISALRAAIARPVQTVRVQLLTYASVDQQRYMLDCITQATGILFETIGGVK